MRKKLFCCNDVLSIIYGYRKKTKMYSKNEIHEHFVLYICGNSQKKKKRQIFVEKFEINLMIIEEFENSKNY